MVDSLLHYCHTHNAVWGLKLTCMFFSNLHYLLSCSRYMYVKKNRSSAPQQTKYNFNIKYQDKTYILVNLKKLINFLQQRLPLKRWGCTALFPFPTSAKMNSDPPKCKRLLSSSPSKWSYSAQSFSYKSMSSCPLTCIGRTNPILPLGIYVWVTLKCHKISKGVFLCEFLIVKGFVWAHVHLVQSTRALSVVCHTQRHCNGPKTFKNG